MKQLTKKYRSIVESSYPVVYVIKANPCWFKKWIEPKNQFSNEYNSKEDVPAESIIAKAEFKKGLKRFNLALNIPLPVPWAHTDEFKKFIDEHKEYNDFKEFYGNYHYNKKT